MAMTNLFYNWEFVSFDPLHLFFPPPLPTSGYHQCVLRISEVIFFFTLYIEVRSHSVRLFLSDLFHVAWCLQGPPVLTQIGRFSSFYDRIIFYYRYIDTYYIYILYLYMYIEIAIYHIFFIHSFISRHLGFFRVLQVTLQWTYGVYIYFN